MMGSKVELLAQIRRDARVEGMSIRALARKHGVHRRTVRQALSSAEPPTRKRPERLSPRGGRVIGPGTRLCVLWCRSCYPSTVRRWCRDR